MNQNRPNHAKSTLNCVRQTLTAALLIAGLSVSPDSAHAGGNMVPYSFPDTGQWYSLHQGPGPAAVNRNPVCRIDWGPCSVSPGRYQLKNWTSGSITLVVVGPEGSCSPAVFEFPNNGHWHSLQRPLNGRMVCRQDMLPCQPRHGPYILKDWSTGESEVIFIRDRCTRVGGTIEPIDGDTPPR